MARPVELTKSSRFITLAAICIVVSALYFAQTVLIPLALAILFCFLLAPLATRLERLRVGRVPAVVIVVLAAVAVVGALGYVVSVQVVNLADRLPQYQQEIVEKARRLGAMTGGDGGIGEKIKDVAEEVERATTQPASQPAETQPAGTQPATQPAESAAVVPDAVQRIGSDPVAELTRAATDSPPAEAAPIGTTRENPIFVAPIEEPRSSIATIGSQLGFVVSPLATAGLVVVFVLFMLIQREDLRDRLIRLVGRGQLNVTTQALDDAAKRISRYMLAMAIVNGTYGIAISIGLWLIGTFVGDKPFPSFVLWGLLCAVLRFIPYVGPWIAAAFPILLSLAVFHGFTAFAWTAGMFVVIELLSNNLMEPWLYGTSTGMSTVAVLVSAVFWTWLWGPIGLLLATPLTVCLVVLGKHVPQLQFLDIMLGDEPSLDPTARIYQRLLALDQEEAAELLRDLIKESSLEAVFDEVLVPALAMAEQDRHKGRLNPERADFVRQSMRALVEEIADEYKSASMRVDEALGPALKQAAADTVAGAKSISTKLTQMDDGNGNSKSQGTRRGVIPKQCQVNVVCLPAHDDADDIVALMLKELLEIQGYCAFAEPVTTLASEMVESVERNEADAVVVSALPPGAVSYSRYLCKRLHARFPDLKMVVGLWTIKGNLEKARERVTCSGAVRLVTTLRDAMDHVHQIVQPVLLEARRTVDEAAEPQAERAANSSAVES